MRDWKIVNFKQLLSDESIEYFSELKDLIEKYENKTNKI